MRTQWRPCCRACTQAGMRAHSRKISTRLASTSCSARRRFLPDTRRCLRTWAWLIARNDARAAQRVAQPLDRISPPAPVLHELDGRFLHRVDPVGSRYVDQTVDDRIDVIRREKPTILAVAHEL